MNKAAWMDCGVFRAGAILSCALGLMACNVAALEPPRENISSPASARSVEWTQAIELLKSGQVAAAVQLHDLSVTLTTEDGAKFVTREPAIDAILAAIAMHAPNAGSIVVATE